jgi:hypothetical protein
MAVERIMLELPPELKYWLDRQVRRARRGWSAARRRSKAT